MLTRRHLFGLGAAALTGLAFAGGSTPAAAQVFFSPGRRLQPDAHHGVDLYRPGHGFRRRFRRRGVRRFDFHPGTHGRFRYDLHNRFRPGFRLRRRRRYFGHH